MEKLTGLEGFPQVHGHTFFEGYSMLIMDVLGANLRTIKD